MDDRNVQSVDIATLHSTDADLHNSRDIAKLPNDEREATELGALDLAPVNALDDPSDVPVVDNAAGSPVPVQPHPPKPRVRHWHDGIQAFWKHYIHLAVPSKDCRDHLGRLSSFSLHCNMTASYGTWNNVLESGHNTIRTHSSPLSDGIWCTCRTFLADICYLANERTFLAYQRTSLVIAYTRHLYSL